MNQNTLHIPIIGRMVKCADGSYHLDKEGSTWADVDADTVARFLVEKFGGDIPGVELPQ